MQQSEKIMLEHQAAKVFMRLYEQQFKQPMRHIWHNQPAKPDVSCYFAGERLDLEIAHLYGSEVEAMHILGRTLTEQTRFALQELALDKMTPPKSQGSNTTPQTNGSQDYKKPPIH